MNVTNHDSPAFTWNINCPSATTCTTWDPTFQFIISLLEFQMSWKKVTIGQKETEKRHRALWKFLWLKMSKNRMQRCIVVLRISSNISFVSCFSKQTRHNPYYRCAVLPLINSPKIIVTSTNTFKFMAFRTSLHKDISLDFKEDKQLWHAFYKNFYTFFTPNQI